MKKKVLHLCYVFLAKCAHRYLKRHKPTVIWINWSVWKTSCRMIIFQTLQKFFPNKKISTSPKNFNWEFWLSLSVFEITKWSPSILNMIKVCCKALFSSLFWKKRYDATQVLRTHSSNGAITNWNNHSKLELVFMYSGRNIGVQLFGFSHSLNSSSDPEV